MLFVDICTDGTKILVGKTAGALGTYLVLAGIAFFITRDRGKPVSHKNALDNVLKKLMLLTFQF